MMELNTVFESFCTSIGERQAFLSEDNIRFYWFASMLKQDCDLNHYSLEEPYVYLKGKELDLMYEDSKEIVCLEIKFHRHKTKDAYAHTMSAGEIFDDLQRLPLWKKDKDFKKPVRFLFLYVTDKEMYDYLSFNSRMRQNSNYRNTLRTFYMAEKGTIITSTFKSKNIGGDTPKVFFECACESFNKEERNSLTISNVLLLNRKTVKCNSCSLQTADCHISLYEIIKTI